MIFLFWCLSLVLDYEQQDLGKFPPDFICSEENKKKQCLYNVLILIPPSSTLVFVKNKMQADFLNNYPFNMGLPSTSVHSNRTQCERKDALYILAANSIVNFTNL